MNEESGFRDASVIWIVSLGIVLLVIPLKILLLLLQ